ncbi:MAG: flavodoxin family protein [Candidatus Moduliflexus flocculans]|nr:flavodoxin family protein [Candidatus Moduliflexus flocculans]
MAKTLVTYFSRTGNTRLVAEAIFGALSGDKTLKPMAEAGDLAPYALVFAGFPVQTHSVPYPAEVFLKTVPEGKKVALFSTHGSVTGSRLSREALEYASVLVAKARLVGTFSCRGKVSHEGPRGPDAVARARGLGRHGGLGGHPSRRERPRGRPRPSPAGSRPSAPRATTAASEVRRPSARRPAS